MAARSSTARVLCVLLALAALLPPALRGAPLACGEGAPAGTAACCCEPAAPACHGETVPATDSFAASGCGCSATTPPATTPQRALWSAAESCHAMALLADRGVHVAPARHARPALAYAATRGAHEVSLLRLHCVNVV
jgi:hypothetical protein